MNIKEKISEEDDSEEKNFKEIIKNFWETCKKNWVWINLGAIITNTLFIWVLYYFNIMSLRFAIFMTIVPPLGIILMHGFQNIKSINTIILMNKIMLVGVVGFVITVPICLFVGYLLIIAPWAPINPYLLPVWLVYAIFPLFFVAIYPFIGYFLYRFGAKREWHISQYY
ncbi:hypothetical protein DSAG12_00604 [Promethearchaeum syntrophicum]|uniref:Uncharacterized protein n=1 Tax=Promethearchaeum syntrophicum TaxID=2594042 RepID=A0A5B9D7G9_9ARCH|nr:hypothetical protein [Candidatus Prometheoarchaeum syntrophicum]QEE14787.1 hypothetical protein DSAG12_00604 [Candidatus Prometheoarchaeum syntrophicum]